MPTRRSERGSAVVEFALVLPLVLLVVLALVQVGLFARDRLLVEAAVRSAVRAAAVQDDDAAVRAAALAAAPGLVEANLTLAITRAGARGSPVTVHVTYVDPVRVPFVRLFVGDGVTMTTSAVARQEFG